MRAKGRFDWHPLTGPPPVADGGAFDHAGTDGVAGRRVTPAESQFHSHRTVLDFGCIFEITWTRDQQFGRSLPVTDYYPLLARAAGALDRNTVTARRVLYARARIAQAGELRKLNPPLAEHEIMQERLALEEAIRKLEAEAARPEVRPGTSLWSHLKAVAWRLRAGLDR